MEAVFEGTDGNRVADCNGFIVSAHAVQPADGSVGLRDQPVVEAVLSADADRDLVGEGRTPLRGWIAKCRGPKQGFEKRRVAEIEVQDLVLVLNPGTAE